MLIVRHQEGSMEFAAGRSDDNLEKPLEGLQVPKIDSLGVGKPGRYLQQVRRCSFLENTITGLEIPGKALNRPFGPHVSGRGVLS